MSGAARTIQFATDDDLRLSGRHLAAENARGAVIISGALGVSQELYWKLAESLTAAGFSTLTFDYRGVGASRFGPLKGQRARLLDWGRDLAAAIEFMSHTSPEVPLSIVGHSAGAQMVGLAKNHDLVRAVYSVAGQSGYWRHFGGRRRHRLWWLVHVVIPTLSRWHGYFPGKRWHMSDLPAGVAREFARWCRDPDYAVGALRRTETAQYFSRFTGTVRLVQIYDDQEFAPPEAVSALGHLFSSATLERRLVGAAEVKGRAIGHFGFFRSTFRRSLWPDCVNFLNRAVDAEGSRFTSRTEWIHQ